MVTSKQFNQLYEALGVEERAVDCELMLPHIERVVELIREKLAQRGIHPTISGCGNHRP